jgi:DNA-binding ferritin-like protein
MKKNRSTIIRSKSKSHKGTMKKRTTDKSHIVKIFIEMLNMVKLYHWKTRSYAQHKATDELYEKMNEHIDKFVEVLLGKDGTRIQMMQTKISLLDPHNIDNFKERIFEYREFLVDLNLIFNKTSDSDLLNIRDEILADINQFLYLLTFNK